MSGDRARFGVIGAGLFVGSGVVIKETGPAAFLTYALTGVLIVLVMRMLGEMVEGGAERRPRVRRMSLRCHSRSPPQAPPPPR